MPFGQPESDYEVFETFVKKHIKEFGIFAYYIVNNYEYAQDGVQNAMEAVMKYYDKVRGFNEQRLYCYCLAVIKHESIHAATKNRNTLSIEEIEDVPAVPDEMLDDMIREANHSTLRKCIEKLPEKYRLVVLMKYYYNCTDHEIAQAASVSDASVRMILTRARKKLKALYLEETGEEVAV